MEEDVTLILALSLRMALDLCSWGFGLVFTMFYFPRCRPQPGGTYSQKSVPQSEVGSGDASSFPPSQPRSVPSVPPPLQLSRLPGAVRLLQSACWGSRPDPASPGRWVDQALWSDACPRAEGEWETCTSWLKPGCLGQGAGAPRGRAHGRARDQVARPPGPLHTPSGALCTPLRLSPCQPLSWALEAASQPCSPTSIDL